MAYCYFHVPGRRPAQGQSRACKNPLKLPPLTDRGAIQIALGQILSAIGSSKLSQRSAGQLLYGLQIASHNVQRAAKAASIAEKEKRKAKLQRKWAKEPVLLLPSIPVVPHRSDLASRAAAGRR
jgi:hypothetical protein